MKVILFIILFFISIGHADTHNKRGQVCTNADLQRGDPGCCASTLLDCSQVGVGNATCCNANSQCTWVTDKHSSLSTKNTCQPDTSISCTGKTIENCVLPAGTYAHGTHLTSNTCSSGYTGVCNYECYGGVWHKKTNDCNASCSSATIEGNCAVTARNHDVGGYNANTNWSGSCKAGYPNGECRYYCNDGDWVKERNTCGPPIGCNKGNSRCNAISVPHGRSYYSQRQCKTGYKGYCNYKNCRNGDMTVTDQCNHKNCPAQTISRCRLSYYTTGGRTGRGKCDYGWHRSGRRCSYYCNRGNLERRTGCNKETGACMVSDLTNSQCPLSFAKDYTSGSSNYLVQKSNNRRWLYKTGYGKSDTVRNNDTVTCIKGHIQTNLRITNEPIPDYNRFKCQNGTWAKINTRKKCVGGSYEFVIAWNSEPIRLPNANVGYIHPTAWYYDCSEHTNTRKCCYKIRYRCYGSYLDDPIGSGTSHGWNGPGGLTHWTEGKSCSEVGITR